MSDTAEPRAPARARASRAQQDAETRQRRRRFSENDEGVDYNLWVDESKLDRRNFAYRWVNDQRGRIHKLESQDWDLVSQEEMGNCPTDRHGDIAAGKSDDIRVRLMRKPIDWYNEDQARKQARIDDQMQAAARGEPMQERGESGDSGGGLAPEHAYRPKMANEGL